MGRPLRFFLNSPQTLSLANSKIWLKKPTRRLKGKGPYWAPKGPKSPITPLNARNPIVLHIILKRSIFHPAGGPAVAGAAGDWALGLQPSAAPASAGWGSGAPPAPAVFVSVFVSVSVCLRFLCTDEGLSSLVAERSSAVRGCRAALSHMVLFVCCLLRVFCSVRLFIFSFSFLPARDCRAV